MENSNYQTQSGKEGKIKTFEIKFHYIIKLSGRIPEFPALFPKMTISPPFRNPAREGKECRRQRPGFGRAQKKRVSSSPEKNFPLLSYRSNLTRGFSLSNLLDRFFSKNRSPFSHSND
ncbi:hypothetical protein CEXT_93821 [Caerostris extrusa]|uniref:Uncharacterized protein n=1 Tax=Caerostris extrusa TaxID=172846 RepID=A0AAV4P410_CAEEX|nr:hypothetical protein CEXT_93821 [Caerostris extrusa]